MQVNLEQIHIHPRLRELDQSKVTEIMESMQEIGQLQPIVIDSEFNLLAGYHRYTAAKQLGWETIQCSISNETNPLRKELIEIDENLMRNDLDDIEQGQHLKRRQEIYELLYPETKNGYNPNQLKNTNANVKIVENALSAISGETNKTSFITDIAPKLNISTRKLYENLQIAKNIIPEAIPIVRAQDAHHKDLLKLVRLTPQDQAQVITKITNTPSKQIHQAIKEIKQETVKANKIANPKLPDGKFSVILADPPWEYNFTESESRAIENQYPTMALEKICTLNIPSDANAILFLWVTSPKLEEGLQVMKRWGFTYKTNMVWVKDKIGMGYYARQQHELLLIGTKGKIGTPLPEDRPSSVINSPRTEHSKKPDIYDMIERMYPGERYLECFARQSREHWQIWGNEQ